MTKKKKACVQREIQGGSFPGGKEEGAGKNGTPNFQIVFSNSKVVIRIG